MAKTVAIVQSNYIPWKGYFELIARSDEFILYDEMQYTRRDWRNRNKIKAANGLNWMTIAVEVKGKYLQKINQTKVAQVDWAQKHWQSLVNAYGKAPYFAQYQQMVKAWYDQAATMTMLSDINRYFIEQICRFLAIETQITSSSDYQLQPGKSERLMHLCKDAGGDCYLSGPAAKDYLDVAVFAREQIDVKWMDYDGYQAYPQLHGDFAHGVSILDVIFCCGPQSRAYVLRDNPHA